MGTQESMAVGASGFHVRAWPTQRVVNVGSILSRNNNKTNDGYLKKHRSDKCKTVCNVCQRSGSCDRLESRFGIVKVGIIPVAKKRGLENVCRSSDDVNDKAVAQGDDVQDTGPVVKPYIKPKMSKEQQAKLRNEYLGRGGSTNQKMGQNWFLNIILFVSLLAVLTKLTGALG